MSPFSKHSKKVNRKAVSCASGSCHSSCAVSHHRGHAGVTHRLTMSIWQVKDPCFFIFFLMPETWDVPITCFRKNDKTKKCQWKILENHCWLYIWSCWHKNDVCILHFQKSFERNWWILSQASHQLSIGMNCASACRVMVWWAPTMIHHDTWRLRLMNVVLVSALS